MHKERVRFAILLFIWITSGALCCPGILYAKVVESNGDSFCRLLWNQSAYKIYHSIGIVLTLLDSSYNHNNLLLPHFKSASSKIDKWKRSARLTKHHSNSESASH